ncbi:MAG: NAD(P)-dependent oxidoreductase [Elusimicrobiota bacterium]
MTSARERYEGKETLVTGAFGFLGGHVCEALCGLGARVTALDIQTGPERPSLLNKFRGRVAIETLDMTDAAAVRALIASRRFSRIFHFAAYATVIERAARNPYETIGSNTMAWVNLLEAVRASGAEPEAVLLASTDKVYGDSGGEEYDEERTPLKGIGVYDAAKLAADVFSRTYHDVYGLPTVTLRLCNIFGPFDFNTEFRLVPRTLEGLYGCEPMRAPELYADSLGHERDYLYVSDAVRAFLLAASEPACRGETFNLKGVRNIGTPEMLEALLRTAAELERGIDAERCRALEAVRVRRTERPSDLRVVVISKQHVSGRKFREAVGFVPEVDFAEGLRRTVRFYRSHFLDGAGA